jgi:hypothetical protein
LSAQVFVEPTPREPVALAPVAYLTGERRKKKKRRRRKGKNNEKGSI